MDLVFCCFVVRLRQTMPVDSDIVRVHHHVSASDSVCFN